MKIALIVGHEEKKQGASNRNGVTEYDYNSRLAKLAAALLVTEGYEPFIVYRDGTTYSKLPERVNKTGADVAISLHCNAFNGQASGSETLHYVNSPSGERLAEHIQKKVVGVMELPDRGLRPVDVKHVGRKGDRGGHLCKRTSMPTVIVETFFIDNDSDLQRGEERLILLAAAIAQGAIDYVESI
ncbi:N-acetylmuramoyl-L-alanine amidase [Vibrio lentus]|uniref:N-acetylmuramoyl-L-alanine amidase n=1 Tax=Vibrio tasmaniensis TaxID=212663 RepID=A0A0H3ZQZ1_9VIBR|nr:N-acetylmuramoyl-L-alanine amidase [Vibrio lentus]AKN38640.1 N-acetylmuramoyl-L-alanine amidase [Vibrio tasmaniensis]PMI58314.1 hypothetical protein BCU41_04045 [Vibrio lentus]